MADAAQSPPQRMAKGNAKDTYCLNDSDLAPLPYDERRNPHYRSAEPMKLYYISDLEQAAVSKWGSLEAMKKEKRLRKLRKKKKALVAAAKRHGVHIDKMTAKEVKALLDKYRGD